MAQKSSGWLSWFISGSDQDKHQLATQTCKRIHERIVDWDKSGFIHACLDISHLAEPEPDGYLSDYQTQDKELLAAKLT